MTVDAGKADQDVLGVIGLEFKEVAIVHGFDDELLHVVGLVGILGHQGVQAQVHAIDWVAALAHRGFFFVVQRQVVEQAAQHEQRLHVVLKRHVSHTALGGVRQRAAQLFGRHLFVRHRFHHIGAGHEHVRRVFDHEDEVGQGGRIHRTTGRWAHDHADLGHHTAGHDVALEHVGVTAQSGDTFLNSGTARIVQADHGSAHLHGLVHDLADFFCVCLGQRAAQHGEVLAVHKDQSAIDHAVARDHTITGNFVIAHAKVGATVLDEHVPLFEGALVEQDFDALTRREFAFGVLSVNALLATAHAGSGALVFKLFVDVLHKALSLLQEDFKSPGAW